MNSFVLIVGNPRTSKSSFAMKMCEELGKIKKQPFQIRKQLAFDEIKKYLLWSQTAIGSTFILDETGTSLSPEQFWELQQRVMRRFVQTQGFRQNILFWVLPSVIFIQKGFRFMSNFGIKTVRQGMVSIYKINVDQLRGKGWFSWLGSVKFGMPSEETWNEYVKYKKEWNDATLKDDIDYIDQMDKPSEKELLRQESLRLSVELKKRRLEHLKGKDKDQLEKYK